MARRRLKAAPVRDLLPRRTGCSSHVPVPGTETSAKWLRDFAAEVLEGARRLLDERVRFLAAAEDVRAGAHGLDAHRPDRVDVALHDELIPERQAPQRHDL